MCEIDITNFVMNEEPFEFSASRAERGENAGPDTWRNANKQAATSPLLRTEIELDAMRQWARESGGWARSEIKAWSDTELNALFIQLVSSDMREAGMDKCFPDEFDWEAYQARAEQGSIPGNIFRSADRIYFYLGS